MNSEVRSDESVVSIPLDVAVLVRDVFLPLNPNKLRNAAPEVKAAAHAFKAAVLRAERKRKSPLPAQARGPLSDSELLDQFSAHPSWELSMDSDPPCGDSPDWLVHNCCGGRNDREWVLIGRGRTVREAITAAIRRTA